MRARPPLDPDRDEARRLFQDELARGDYQLQESWVSRAWRWFTDLFSGFGGLGPLPGWVTWVLLALVLVAVLAVLAFATRDRWRTARLSGHGAPGAVLEGPARAASEHRQEAAAALGAGDHDRAVLEAYRAVAAGAVERTFLDDRPGRTAHELATGLAPVFPDARDELLTAADAFDAVRYGDHRATAEQARQVVDLDARLDAARPALAETAS
ncbi:DUF4129 domain-containing protein [Ornithinimicrobium sufpigmenti]|uniref:DUF4129 domain-containing protein n=1 Tax=Ornithinimicrobium sufpigmenti TaxID=2508882 RepID=UPI001036B87D|nr:MULTISPECIES: DUF4129 domain-containing protein [unclassified Ornithinimicrobium]